MPAGGASGPWLSGGAERSAIGVQLWKCRFNHRNQEQFYTPETYVTCMNLKNTCWRSAHSKISIPGRTTALARFLYNWIFIGRCMESLLRHLVVFAESRDNTGCRGRRDIPSVREECVAD